MGALYGIDVFSDNRIKVGNVLPSKDSRSYRCHKNTMALLKDGIDKHNALENWENLRFRGIYQPFLAPRTEVKP